MAADRQENSEPTNSAFRQQDPGRLTSRHDGADVLQREHRQLLLRVDPDHAVAQTLHGQDAATRGAGVLLQRPAADEEGRAFEPNKK